MYRLVCTLLAGFTPLVSVAQSLASSASTSLVHEVPLPLSLSLSLSQYPPCSHPP